MKRWWPQSLSGRLAIILISGMLAAQALTGTIWYDMRYQKSMEIPTRLAATRLADALRVLDAAPAVERDTLLQSLSGPGLALRRIAARAPGAPPMDANQTATARLFEQVLQQRRAHALPLLMLRADVDDEIDSDNDLHALMLAQYPVGLFTVQVALADGSWLQAKASEGEAGMDVAPTSALLDYLLRIYVLRAAAIALLAWLAVRLAMKPLGRLAEAAEQLGNNIHSAPLATGGPLEVRKASLAFNAMQRRLIDNIAERTRFLAAVSHDLRSPITRMRLRAEMLPDPLQQARFRKDLDEMDAMIAATLNVVQDTDVHEQPQLIDIDSLLASLRTDLAEIGASVTIAGRAAPLPGYPRSLKRCLQNVVENAVRYGEEAHVQVIDGAARLKIVVTDRGPGIPEAMLERVLEPFYRLEPSRNAGTGGFGLGLSIAHTVAMAHNGTLALRNLPKRGLEVRLTLNRQALAKPLV